MRRRAVAAALLLLAGGLAGSVSAAPERVVSLNLCTDELLLMLADRSQVRSVTWLVADPQMSWLADQVDDIALNYGRAEEIIAMQPDLVLAGVYTTTATVALLERFGLKVLRLATPTSIDGAMQQIALVAEALGQQRRGQELLSQMQSRLLALPQVPDGIKPTVAIFQPNGLTATAGTLVDDVLRTAGLNNLAVQRGLPNYAQLPIEIMLLDRPDVLVMNHYEKKAPSLAQELLQHPAIQKAYAERTTVVVPAQAWTCGTPHLIDAVEMLRQAAITAARV